jgi:hypothetical protein
MFCSKCGKANLDNAMFCAGCGAELTGKRPASKTWLSTTAAILDIVAGSLVPLYFVFPVAAMLFVMHEGGEVNADSGWFILPAVVVISSIVAIVAGIHLLRRKHRGTALAGAIGATLTLNPVGVAALVLTIAARKEFE